MRRLSSLAWRSLLARRLRTFLTTAGIALGVGVLFAALATNAAVDASVDRTVVTLLGNANLRVSAFQEVGLSDATQEAIAQTPGVLVAAPQIERRTYLQVQAVAGSPLRPPVTVLGIDPALDARVHPMTPVQGTVFGPGTRAALISETLAAEDGLGLGSVITILGRFSPENSTFTVAGLLAGGGPLPTSGDRIVVIPIEAAKAVFGLSGVSRVDIVTAPGNSPEQISGRLEARLRSEPYILSAPSDVAASLRASTSDFQSTMALIAAITLFVGALLIFNTLSMSVVERVREVALLRAAGATRDQVYWLVLLQAAALGIAGSIAGVALGWILSLWLIGALAGASAAVGSVPVTVAAPTIGSIALALAVGLVVTLAAAIEPAWRAGRISPVEALKQRPDLSLLLAARLRWLLVVFVVVGIVALIIWPRASAGAGLAGSFVVYGLLLIVTLLSPLILPALGRVVGVPFGLVLRAEERLARGTLSRERSRTALTVGSLTIGLALIVALAAVGQNDRRAATAWLANVVPGDELATSIRPIPLEEGVQTQLKEAGGVERVTPIARFDLAYEGTRVDGASMPGRDLLDDGRLTFVSGDRTTALNQFDDGGLVILPRTQAERFGLRLGDRMRFTTADGGSMELRVAGVIERGLPGRTGEAMLIAWSDATSHFGVLGADAFAIRFAPGTQATNRVFLEQVANELALQPASIEAVQGAAGDTLDQVFALFDALAAIAVIVAGLGIINTLTMNVIERVREIGVLRAVGMTRRQVYRMVVVEAGVIGLMGVVLGCITGLVLGVLMIGLAAGLPGVATIQFPLLILVFAAVFGIVVSMIAAIYPARLAAGMSIVRAVQYE